MISITLIGRDSRKFELDFLDAYAFKKYKTKYIESKTAVNADIKALSEKYQTSTVRDLKMLVYSELIPVEFKKEYLEERIGGIVDILP